MLKTVLAVAALMWTSVVILADAATPPTAHETVHPLLSRPLPNIPGKAITSVIVDYSPGARSSPHRHSPSAFIYAFVLAGSIESRVDGGIARVYGAGEFFIELPGEHHVVSANASQSEPASMLVVFVAAEGEPLTLPDASS